MKTLIHALRDTYDYDPETGLIWSKISGKGHSPGKILVNRTQRGYIDIEFQGKHIMGHRLAWVIIHGEFPKKQLDHINGIKHDNRLCNLRECTNRENARNTRRHREGALPGIRRSTKNPKKWEARIKLRGKLKHLGIFTSPKMAYEAYMIACRKSP